MHSKTDSARNTAPTATRGDPPAGDVRAAAAVFFDGGCPVCRREVAWYRGMSGADAAHWVDVADPATPLSDLPEGLDRRNLLLRFTAVRHDGSVARGAAAFVALWRRIDRLRLLGRMMDNGPCLWIGERLYRGFLRVRALWRPAR